MMFFGLDFLTWMGIILAVLFGLLVLHKLFQWWLYPKTSLEDESAFGDTTLYGHNFQDQSNARKAHRKT